jgi:nucleoside-diphosphate-sugar epimerase
LYQQKHLTMKVFVTGASGFIGAEVVKELIGAGHQVVGLARSVKSAQIVRDAGAAVLMGSLDDLDILKQGASEAEGVIHAAFFHDFTQFVKAADMDKKAINALGEALMGTNKPLVVTAGILGLPLIDGFITEESKLQGFLRVSENAALELAAKGVNASVVRLSPSVHDKGDAGFVPFIIAQARKNGVAGYPGEGKNRWTAVHRLDAAKAFRLALEKSAKGAVYNVVGDTGIEVKKIAELISQQLNLPLVSLNEEENAQHYEWLSSFITLDTPATNFKTQEQLGWTPTHMGLLDDMKANYF